jgi:hypothetical protein
MIDVELESEIERALVIFAKAPEPGRVKTRLTEELSSEEAASLYERFLMDLVGVARRMSAADDTLACMLSCAGEVDHPFFELLTEGGTAGRGGVSRIGQGDGDLGDRLAAVTSACFEAGAGRVVVIGSDSPTLGPDQLEAGFEALDRADISLGPSFDGGYYLVGMRRPAPEIFEGIDWSTRDVLEQTLARCHDRSLLCELLEFWYDVDTFEDLERLKFHLLDYLQRHNSEVAEHTAAKLRVWEAEGRFESSSR